MSQDENQSDPKPRRVGERQGLQTGELRDGQERNKPYEPISEGAKKALERGNYGPSSGTAESTPGEGLRKENK